MVRIVDSRVILEFKQMVHSSHKGSLIRFFTVCIPSASLQTQAVAIIILGVPVY